LGSFGSDDGVFGDKIFTCEPPAGTVVASSLTTDVLTVVLLFPLIAEITASSPSLAF